MQEQRCVWIWQLLNNYHEHSGVILPTAGAVLDMGRTLTHKTIVVEMSLEGLSTKQIARRIYHTPETVDNWGFLHRPSG